MSKLDLEYNSTYISLNLIDELDYIIGGYDKPNITFIYTLNTFIESFILNSKFYISDQEFKHLHIVSKSIFPNGRPILELITKTKCLSAIGGIGNNIGQVVSIGKFDPNNPTSYQERIQEYVEKGLDTKDSREKYLKISILNEEVEKLSFLNIGRVEDGYVALVSHNSPQDFFNKLNELTYYSNVQATLPYYCYKNQLNEFQNRGLGKEIITRLTDVFESKQAQINQYFGYTNQHIPPLVNILLSQCNSINDIPDKIYQLREDFTLLRKSLVKYEAQLSEAKNIKEQIDAIEELNAFWITFNKKYSENNRLIYNFWEVAENSDYEKSIDSTIDNQSITGVIEDLNLGKVIGKSTKKIIDMYKEKKIINRFRGVTDLWSLFNKSPNIKEHIKNFERVFNVKIEEKALQELRKEIGPLNKQTNIASTNS